MESVVFLMRHQLQVAEAIVGFDFVFVMNGLGESEIPSNLFFHDEAVLSDVAARVSERVALEMDEDVAL
jgi:hypothetical protein